MKLNRTRIVLLGILGILLAGALVGTLVGSGSDGETAGSPADDAGRVAGFTDFGDTEALPPDEGLNGMPYSRSDGRDAADDAGSRADAPAGEPGGADAALQVMSRKIVQSASMDLEVEEVSGAFQEIIRIASTAGADGGVISSSFSYIEDNQIADLTIRVPSDRYQDVLTDLRGLGEVQREESTGNDVTEEYTDLDARLRNLQATEQRYLELLGQAVDINEILMVQDRLDGIRAQIEQVQGRLNLLNGLTSTATITIHLRPPALGAGSNGGGPHPLEAGQAAWEHSLDALRGVATGIVVVSVFSWWLLPPLAALAFGVRWWLGRRQGPASQATT